MITPLTITGLDQGKLYGENPTVEALSAQGDIIHARKLRALGRKLPTWKKPLAWRELLTLCARTARG